MSRGEEWVRLAEVANEVAATLTLEMLREAGIPCFAKAAGAGVGYFSASVLPHFIFVPREQVDRAKEVLSAAVEIPPEIADEAD